MARLISDALQIMRLAISRRNELDPDSDDKTLLRYFNDFVHITMGTDVKLFEQYGTLTFEINETVEDGIYTFNDVGADYDFETISPQGFISLTVPPSGSLSWTPLEVFLSPEQFYSHWGVENDDVLTAGMPSQVLFYGNNLVFRTIPDTGYTVTLYGYKKNLDVSSSAQYLEFDHWLRYVAYGAALAYAKDYNYEDKDIAKIKSHFGYERRQQLQRTHDRIKMGRGQPSY